MNSRHQSAYSLQRPALSVVMPFNGSPDLCYALASLARQSLAAPRFELLLVCEREPSTGVVENSEFASSIKVLTYERPSGFEGHSAAAMRNHGALHAQSDRLLFLDSDCIIGPRALELHSRGDSSSAICGVMHELPAARRSWLAESHDFAALLGVSLRDPRSGDEPAIRPGRWTDFYSCNGSIPRAAFEAVNGFDEAGYRCHDMDLGYRLHREGVAFLLASECQVIHLEHPRVAASRLEQAAGWEHLAQKYPELRPFADRRIKASRRAWAAALSESEGAFRRVTAGWPGMRAGTVWIMPPGTNEDELTAELHGLAWARVKRDAAIQLYLCLHRNCWDYSIMIPEDVTPRITVAIPAYNAAATIETAIASVLVQTMQAFELLVIDDASSDETAPIVASASDPRVRLVSLDINRGLAHAMNVAIDLARAPYLLQLDADDWLAQGALEAVYKALECQNADAVYGFPMLHSTGSIVARESGLMCSRSEQFLTASALHAPRAYRIDTLRRIGGWATGDPFHGRFFEDRLTLCRVAEIGTVTAVDGVQYHVTLSKGSLSRGHPQAANTAKFVCAAMYAARSALHLSAYKRGTRLRVQFGPRLLRQPSLPWTVVIPCRNQPELLELALQSWLESDFASNQSSALVVVDDGSDTPLECSVRVEHPRVRFIRAVQSKGPAHARNLGAATARDGMVMFADGDHIVPPDVLSVHEQVHSASPHDAVVCGGVFKCKIFTVLDPGGCGEWYRRRLLDLLEHDPSFGGVAEALAGGERICLTSRLPGLWKSGWRLCFVEQWAARWAEFLIENPACGFGSDVDWLGVAGAPLSMSLTVFKRLGGFCEEFRIFEDWDFGVRAQDSGAAIVPALGSWSFHQVHPRTRPPQDHVAAAKHFASRHPRAIERLKQLDPGRLPPGGATLLRHLASMRYSARPHGPPAAGSRQTHCAITFDDGPHPTGTKNVLEVLAEHQALATFFVQGNRIRECSELIRRLISEGHEIGLHGWEHAPMDELAEGDIIDRLRRALRALADVAQVPASFVRPPYGRATRRFLLAARRLRLVPVGWHVSARDWSPPRSKDVIKNLATAGIAGKVILMHDSGGDAIDGARSLRWLLGACRAHRITPRRLSDYQAVGEIPQPKLVQS